MSKADVAPEESWLQALRAGDPDRAWDIFIGEYRALIFAIIRHYTHDHDEVMDVFAEVCSGLRHDSLARLKKYWDQPTHTARFSTWLVTVVRHLIIDWMRQHVLRRRAHFPASLSRLQERIVEFVFLQHRSHVETYELIRSTIDPALSFADFVRELRATYSAIDQSRGSAAAREMVGAPPIFVSDDEVEIAAEDVPDPVEILDAQRRITNALSSLEPDERLAVEMFVVHEMPAAAIARALGWPNAKAVYNRVYRALGAVRAVLKREGFRREDL